MKHRPKYMMLEYENVQIGNVDIDRMAVNRWQAISVAINPLTQRIVVLYTKPEEI